MKKDAKKLIKDKEKKSLRRKMKKNETSVKIMENILPIGNCKCGETLFMYLGSEYDNMLNVYCSGTGCAENVRDIRFLANNDVLFDERQRLFDFLSETYGKESFEKRFEEGLSSVIESPKVES